MHTLEPECFLEVIDTVDAAPVSSVTIPLMALNMPSGTTPLDYCGGVDGRRLQGSMTPTRLTAVEEPPPRMMPLLHGRYPSPESFVAAHPGALLLGRHTDIKPVAARLRNRFISRVAAVVERFSAALHQEILVVVRDRVQRVLDLRPAASEDFLREFAVRLGSDAGRLGAGKQLTPHHHPKNTALPLVICTAVGNTPLFVNGVRLPPSVPLPLWRDDVLTFLEPHASQQPPGVPAFRLRHRSPSPVRITSSRS